MNDLPWPDQQPFLEVEVGSGYPLSLIPLISRLSEFSTTLRACSLSGHGFSPGSSARSRSDHRTVNKIFLQTLIDRWKPPSIPSSVSVSTRLVLLTAWRSIQGAANIYHRRGLGFYSNLTEPIEGLIQEAYTAAIEDLVVNISFLTRAFQQCGTCIANSMAQPIAVMGSECGGRATAPLQDDVTKIITTISETFLLPHLLFLLEVLQKLWERQAMCESRASNECISLEQVTRDNGLFISLL